MKEMNEDGRKGEGKEGRNGGRKRGGSEGRQNTKELKLANGTLVITIIEGMEFIIPKQENSAARKKQFASLVTTRLWIVEQSLVQFNFNNLYLLTVDSFKAPSYFNELKMNRIPISNDRVLRTVN